MTIKNILTSLYSCRPHKPLYHYTSLKGAMGIVASKTLWATDIRFFNDSSELNQLVRHLNNLIIHRIESGEAKNSAVLAQFSRWLKDRIGTFGHSLYVVSFTTNGNLLSQWRGYCPTSQGVSLGFDEVSIPNFIASQSFGMASCIYDSVKQRDIAKNIIDEIEALGVQQGEEKDISKRHPSESYHRIFESCEEDILQIAALFKHPSFHEEQEWRAVSNVVKSHIDIPIEYREGTSNLIPFIRLHLPKTQYDSISLKHVYLGPTPNVSNSMTSLSQYLSGLKASPKQGLEYCQIPYRAW